MSCLTHGADEPRVQAEPDLPLDFEASMLRHDIIEALYAAGGGHYGGSLSVLDTLLVLYRRVLRVSPALSSHPHRDRLILSKGHAAIALYAILRRLGFFTDALAGYGSNGSRLEGHPDMTTVPGVDFSTGSLGQGLAVGLGMAMTLRQTDQHVWVVLGDGECQEGQVWEAAMLAARYRTANLHAVVDANGFQECPWPEPHAPDTPPVDNLAQRWAAFGWQVRETDGHDHRQLTQQLSEASTTNRPSVVLALTQKGHGFPVIERDPVRFHCTKVTPQEQEQLRGAAP